MKMKAEVKYLNDDNKFFKNELLETAFIIVFMCIYSLVGIYSFQLALLLLPVGFIFIGVKNGIEKGILGFLIVSIFIGIFRNPMDGILLFLLFMPIIFINTYLINKRRRSIEIILSSAIVFFISIMIVFLITQNVTGVSIVKGMEAQLKYLLDSQLEVLRESGLTNFEILRMREILEVSYKSTLLIFPSALLLASLTAGYINYYISALLLRKSGIGIVSVPRFSRFKLPGNFIFGIIVMYLGTFIMKYFRPEFHEAIVANLLVFISSMLLLQGLSVIDFYLVKRKLNILLRVIIIILVGAPLGSIISLVGVGDIIFDFRKLKSA